MSQDGLRSNHALMCIKVLFWNASTNTQVKRDRLSVRKHIMKVYGSERKLKTELKITG